MFIVPQELYIGLSSLSALGQFCCRVLSGAPYTFAGWFEMRSETTPEIISEMGRLCDIWGVETNGCLCMSEPTEIEIHRGFPYQSLHGVRQVLQSQNTTLLQGALSLPLAGLGGFLLHLPLTGRRGGGRGRGVSLLHLGGVLLFLSFLAPPPLFLDCRGDHPSGRCFLHDGQTLTDLPCVNVSGFA